MKFTLDIYKYILFFFLNLKNFIYFWLHWVFVVVLPFPLVVACGGYSLVAVSGLLTAVASLVAERQL